MSEIQTSETVEIFPRLSYRMSTGSGRRYDGADYVLGLKVKINAICDSIDDSGVALEPHLGDLSAVLIRVCRAWNEGGDLAEIFDETQEIYDLGASLYTPDFNDFSDEVRAAFPFAESHLDLLLIRDLRLHPAARGQRAGISALHRFVTEWQDNCSFVALEAQPTQFLDGADGWDGWQDSALSGFPDDRDEATAKLENHFCGLGFAKVDTVSHLLLCPAMQQAPLEEMALEDSIVLSKAALQSIESA